MSEILLLIVVVAIITAGTVMMTGSVLYFMVVLYRLFRGGQAPANRGREASPGEADR